jgi:hypothetical protein
MNGVVLLAEAERILRRHDPATFATAFDAAPECVEYVRAVEDEQAWKAAYPSLEAFYAAHVARHPCIEVYAAVAREIDTAGPFEEGPGGPIWQRIERHCREAQTG